jgi:hypothetical protein
MDFTKTEILEITKKMHSPKSTLNCLKEGVEKA